VAIAAVAGGLVIRTGLRPVGRLTEAAERVARTDDLRPIPVFGSDELARLTEAFNTMLRALAESRERQARLVADAGHELRTPLTSLRTNVELLMASQAPGAPPLPDTEMAELRADVLGQIEELSTLVDTDVNFPAIDLMIFPAFESDLYHTGTAWTQNPVYSWRVSFSQGEVIRDFSGGRLLLVRDAP